MKQKVNFSFRARAPYMHVCVNMCMHVCMCVCMHVCMYVYVCMYACVWERECTFMFINEYYF